MSFKFRLAICLGLGSAVFPLTTGLRGADRVMLHVPLAIEVEMTVYKEPLLYTDDSFSTQEGTQLGPVWMSCFVNYRRPDLSPYELWSKGFSNEYLQRNGISEASHARTSAARKNQGPVQTRDISFLWSVSIRAKGREFIYVASYQFGHLSKFPEKRGDLKFAIVINCFEKIDGRWRMQITDVFPELGALPLGSVEQMGRLISSGSEITESPTSLKAIGIPK